MDKLEILDTLYFQGKYSKNKTCNFSTQRIEIIVRNKRDLHPSQFSIDDNKWSYIELKEYVKNPELQEFVKNYLAKDFKKNQDPSYFVFIKWHKKNFETNKFEKYEAVYFPQQIKSWDNYKEVMV